MGKKYTEEEIVSSLQFDSYLYKSSVIMRKGSTSKANGNIFYTEIAAKEVLDHLTDEGLLPNIDVYVRANYVGNRNKTKQGQGEEKLQRDIARGIVKPSYDFGTFLTFEAILHGNGKGVDLVFYNQEENAVYLIELKKENAKDTLLRCVLEIETYFQRFDGKKLIQELNEKFDGNVPLDAKIRKALLLPPCNALSEYESDGHQNVKKLIEVFDVVVAKM